MVSTIRTSAPGKLMLLGEHAVLHGSHCLVCAIDRRITVTLTPRPDAVVTITAGFGRYEGRLPELPDDECFRFVLAALRRHSDILPSGCDLVIDSDFPNAVRIRKPISGKAGSNARYSNIVSPLQLFHGVSVQSLNACMQPQNQSQPYRDLGSRHGDDKEEHHLAVGDLPMRASHNKS